MQVYWYFWIISLSISMMYCLGSKALSLPVILVLLGLQVWLWICSLVDIKYQSIPTSLISIGLLLGFGWHYVTHSPEAHLHQAYLVFISVFIFLDGVTYITNAYKKYPDNQQGVLSLSACFMGLLFFNLPGGGAWMYFMCWWGYILFKAIRKESILSRKLSYPIALALFAPLLWNTYSMHHESWHFAVYLCMVVFVLVEFGIPVYNEIIPWLVPQPSAIKKQDKDVDDQPTSLGGADVLLFACLGLALGFPAGLAILVLTCFIAGVFYSFLMIKHKVQKSPIPEHIPLFPFICIATQITVFIGLELSWWCGLT